MTQIMIDVKPETAQHIHAMLPAHPGLTFPQLAGHMLDARVAWHLEVERMKPATVEMDHPFGGRY